MTSKTEVAEVSEVAEKGGSSKSSFRDLPVPDCHGSSDHNQACDLDKSYVFVNGTDEFVNDAVSEKDMSVSRESEAAATVEERGNGELDGTSEDVVKPMNEGDIADRPVENGSSGEYESSQVGREDGVSAFEKSGKAEVEQTEAGLVKEKVGDQTGTAEGVAELGNSGDLKKSETCPSPVENQESIAGALEFPTESAANEELTNMCEDEIVIGECMHQNHESSVERSQMSQGSKVGVVDVVECKSQDLSLLHEDEEKLALEVVEATEQEVPPLTSSELDMELHTVNNEEEWLNGDAKTNSLLDMHENQQLDMSGDGSSLVVLEHGNRTTNAVSSVNCPVECVNDLALEEKNEESFASHVATDIQYPEEPVTCNGGSGFPCEIIEAVTKAEVLESDETLPAIHCENPVAEDSETVSALPVDGKTIHVMESALPDLDKKVESSIPGPTVADIVTQEEADDVVVLTEKEPTLQGNEGAAESEILNGLAEVSDSQSATLHLKLESEVHVQTFSAVTNGEKVEILSGTWTKGVIDSLTTANGSVDNDAVGIEDVEKNQNMVDKIDGAAEDSKEENVFLAEHKVIGESDSFTNCFNTENGSVDNDVALVKLESEVDAHDLPARTSEEKNDIESGAHGAEVLDSSNSSNGVADPVAVIEITKNMSDSCPAGVIHENECLHENGATGNSDCDNKSEAESEGSLPNMCLREEASVKTKTKPFNFLVRVPRFDDENLKEQIRLAKLNVDEKTKLRDAIQVLIQKKRASNQVHGVDYEFAKEENRSARKLVRSKRMEIDSLQSMINKAKNALSIEDIDSQIHIMEHMIQHETLPLKEEKQLIRDIKQLKQLREQLSSNLGSRAEIENALEQREEVEERLKMLRKELDVLKDKVLKAEAAAAEAEKRYDDENRKVRELQTQFRAADDVRQSAYAQLQNLRKELSKKSKHFFKYKDTAAVANNYAFSGNSEALYCLCTDNVQNFMELWNTDDEFRKEYVRCNVRSTIRRFGTLDGRSLGPNEKPIILPKYADERNGSMKATPSKEVQQEKINEIVVSNGLPKPEATEHKKQKVAIKEPDVAGGDAIDQVQEEPKKSAKEMELITKTEEFRGYEDEAKLKEQRRLEALTKADEARERKKRRAEKSQMRAELKIQKEAEEREKERERRLRKKERKMVAPMDANNTTHNVSSESAPEIIKDIPNASPKKPQKQKKKSKSVPPPLRNRNKRKLQQWMWVVISSLIIIVLFWLGNIGMFFTKNLSWRSPDY